jgi:hypothetical protein
MTPTVGGSIDETFFKRYDATVQAALATGAYVILDLVSDQFQTTGMKV